MSDLFYEVFNVLFKLKNFMLPSILYEPNELLGTLVFKPIAHDVERVL